ncbi:MAG: riboflavin synthase [Candidatus Magasanikbacteria bacterium]|nr:riboflavin synthase [Candidatus Magasanikbacteria bacterium]
MFSGIIQETVKAKNIRRQGKNLWLQISAPKGFMAKVGESVSVDGICSTVEQKKDNYLSFYYMPETLRKTTISKTPESHLFNLERSLTLQSLIGGHLMSGHIDTTAVLESISTQGKSKLMKFRIDQKFTKYIIYKGSIALNGVSLTVVSAGKDYFTVSIIPYTQRHTNLGQLKIGNTVNIELDLIAKYLEKLCYRQPPVKKISRPSKIAQ